MANDIYDAINGKLHEKKIYIFCIYSDTVIAVFNPLATRKIYANQTQNIIQSAKTHGCLWSGLLDGANDNHNVKIHLDDEFIPMLSQSRCLFLSRSVETWVNPPDFTKIRTNIQRIKTSTGKDYVYEMMFAEVIPAVYKPDFNSDYSQFDFLSMCADSQTVDYGRRTDDLTARKQIYNDFQRTFDEELPTLFLFYPKYFNLTRREAIFAIIKPELAL